MPRPRAPWWLFLAAGAYLGYFALTVYCDVTRPVYPGIEIDFHGGRMRITAVAPGSPADAAGLKPEDVVLARDGEPVRSKGDWNRMDLNLVSSQPIVLDLDRGGQPRRAVLLLPAATSQPWTSARLAILAVRAVQLVTLGLGLLIAFRRPDAIMARVGGWLLATVGVFSLVLPYRMAAVWRGLGPAGAPLWFPFLSTAAIPAVILTFFAVFPAPRIRSRGGWLLVWLPALAALVPGALYTLRLVYWPDTAAGRSDGLAPVMVLSLGYAAALIVLLVIQYRGTGDTTERRRLRVLVLGSAAGSVAAVVLTLLYWFSSVHLELLGSPAFILGTLLLLVTPLSFAYAILRHRLFDVRVIIRQGVQYALARRVLLSLVPALAVLLVLDVAGRRDQPIAAVLASRGWMYGVLGAVALVAQHLRGRWLDALDRRFFRERYDATRLLRRVADDLRAADTLDAVADAVVAQVEMALHPEFVALCVRDPWEPAFRDIASTGAPPPEPPAGDMVAIELARVLGRPLDASATGRGSLASQLPDAEVAWLRSGRVEMLVPIATAGEERQALLVLGMRRSEEPYSAEDRELLAAVAGSLALVLARPASAARSDESFAECPECGACSTGKEAHCATDGAVLTLIRAPRVLAGRYRLDRRLGRGGMGTVYAGHDAALARPVAVKLLREDLVDNARVAERFRQEARAAARFAHPNVVTVHDFGVTGGGRGYLVMELLHGRTLREELRQAEALEPRRAVSILRGVAAAVEAAHEREIVHRDLKPENIILVETGGSPVAKVLDFGIAKVLDPGETGYPQAGDTAGLLGTLPYMAPEQLRGEAVAPQWDLWALAVVACEMLTGRHPFAGLTVLRADPLSPVQVGVADPLATAPPAVAAFFRRALAPDPTARFQGAAAFMAALEQALET